jgi:Ca2+-binding RTX toxin-like protein
MPTFMYLDKTDLPIALKNGNLDPAAQTAIISQLIADGLYDSGSEDGKAIYVEIDTFGKTPQGSKFDSDGNPNPSPGVQLLQVTGSNVTVHTNSTLKVIVDDGDNPGGNTLTVTGSGVHDDEFIVLGKTSTRVNLQDHGRDTVLGGAGNDTIDASASTGNDSLIAGKGDDLLIGGSGADTLTGGSGHDTLVAGTGHDSLLQAGAGATLIVDTNSGGNDTLVAGTGKDTITGQQGDVFDTVAGSGHDVYSILAGGGNSTINLGSGGHDTVNFFTAAGNDTINISGGHDTIDFTHSANNLSSDIAQITAGGQSGEWLITFKNGQTMDINAHGVSHNQTAFELHFLDGSITKPGGT